MKLFCWFGLHRWTIKATARPGTTVRRCRRCPKLVVRHARPSGRPGDPSVRLND